VYAPKVSKQDTSTPAEIVVQAYDFLAQNTLEGTHGAYGYNYSFVVPSAYKYGPSQWLWGIPLERVIDINRFRCSSNCLGAQGRESVRCGSERYIELPT
jgi:hypothetical protein